jgi:CHAT domain-containing protein
MKLFYENLWQKGLPKLEALRQAQQTMVLDYDVKDGRLRGAGKPRYVDPNAFAKARRRLERGDTLLPPYYWASFLLNGDWR